MKKHLLAFSLVAVVIATFLVGCGSDSGPGGCSGTTQFVGTDTGYHRVYLNGADVHALVPDIQDTMTVTSTSTTTITLHDNALQRDLFGTLDPSNCNKVILDSVIFGAGDTLVINSATLGRVTIYNIRAGGSGTISGSTVATSIKIKKGNTNIGPSPVDLRSLTNVELKGNFKVVP